MKKTTLLCIAVLALIIVAVPLFSAAAQDKMPAPIDPQSWQMNRERTWSDFIPNPVINWKQDVNPAGYYNVRNSANRVSKIRGALCLFEYLDRPFITSQPVGSDVLGYYMFKPDGSGLDYAKGIVHNPIISQPRSLKESEYSTNPNDPNFQKDPVFANWWKDFLIGDHPANNGSSQEEFYLENTYGKYHLQFDAYGPWEVNCFEFEIRDSYQNNNDQMPPSFRSPSTGAPTVANPGNLRSTGTIDTFAFALMSEKLGNSFIINNYDFFHILHAGYDESGVWQEFGMGQYPTRKDLPDELTPIGRMHKVEEVFNARPELLAIYADRYRGTAAPGRTFWAAELAKYNALKAAGKADEYVFALSADDWNWANNWKNTTTRNTRYVSWTSWEAAVGEWSHMSSTGTFGSSRNYSTQGECDAMATFAHEFGHISGIGDNYDNPYTYRGNPKTEPWELMSRGSFSGPFGDHGRWTCPGMEGGSVPTHFMAFNKSASSSYDTAAASPDYLTVTKNQLRNGLPVVAEVAARNIPLNNNKTTARPQGLYPWLETEFDIPLAAPYVYKAIRLNFGSGTDADVAVLKSSGFSQFPARATVMWVEVVQRTGYDSFAPDDGVLIARGNAVVDSHCYDIGLIDYMVPDGLTLSAAAGGGKVDDYFSYPLAHMAQLYDATFHAGKSVTDTGYYKSAYQPGKFYVQTANGSDLYNIAATAPQSVADFGGRYFNSESSGMSWQQAMTKPGSIVQWEKQDGRQVASGDTVNEWYDTANKLHFYILAKNDHAGRYGDFLTYTIGMLHDDGTAVGGDLNVAVGQLEKETPGRVAVANFEITNTGNATDIIRVGVQGELSPLLLNNLYAVGAGETITVPVYVDLPVDIRTKNMGGKLITLSASSESNSAKLGSASVLIADLINYNYGVYFKTNAAKLNPEDTLLVDVMLTGDTNYTQFMADVTYDPAVLQCTGYENMSGFISACAPTAPNTIGIRSVPSTNMVLGVPSTPDVRIVTLKFTVKGSLTADITTALNFSTVVVNPPAGYLLSGTAPALPVDITFSRNVPTLEEAKFLELVDYDHVEYLSHYISEEIGNRYTASFRRDICTEWLLDEFSSYGYTPYVHTFTNPGGPYNNGSFEVFGNKYMYYGPAYNATSVYKYSSSAELVIEGVTVLNWANSSNALTVPPGTDYDGQAVFVTLNGTAAPSAGNYYSAALALQNAGAGAVLFQLYPEAANGNTTYSRIGNTTSGTNITIPVGYTLNYETKGIVAQLAADTEVKLTMQSRADGKNVVAVLPATQPTLKTVYITSHYDTTASGPGMNDNGSGTVMTLEMARAFKNVPFEFNLVFVVFDAEETGLRGAYAFCADMTQEERANFVANYNMDMIATSQANCEWMFMNISDARLSTMQGQIPTGNNNALADNPAAVAVAQEYGIYTTTMKAAERMNFTDHVLFCYDTTTDHWAFVRYGNGYYDNHVNMMNAVEYDWRSNRRGTGFETLYHKVGDTYELNFSLDRCKVQADIISLAIFYAGKGRIPAGGVPSVPWAPRIPAPPLAPIPQLLPVIEEIEEITEIFENVEALQIDVLAGDALEIEVIE